jgi:hypothetical protein
MFPLIRRFTFVVVALCPVTTGAASEMQPITGKPVVDSPRLPEWLARSAARQVSRTSPVCRRIGITRARGFSWCRVNLDETAQRNRFLHGVIRGD